MFDTLFHLILILTLQETISQMRKFRLIEVKEFSQGHTTSAI
jgi:hypothetical protein